MARTILLPPDDERPHLSRRQEEQIFQAAGMRVASVVRGAAPLPLAEVLGETGSQALYGAFVSLKRSGRLRSCCGCLGESIPLVAAVEQAAVRAAKEDPRFPPISPSEMEHLDMEVWLLWGPRPIVARGEEREACVEIGRHGLQVARGSQRGLLLPGVAVELKLDARRFLEQVCVKAGLPIDAWKQDETTVFTFEGRAIHGHLGATVQEPVESPVRPTAAEMVRLVQFTRENLAALLVGATPSYYLPEAFDDSVCGLGLSVAVPGQSGESIESSALSLRAEKPLQSTLFSLAQATAEILRSRGVRRDQVLATEVHLTVLSDPAMHGTAEVPDLKGLDPRRRAVVVADGVRTVWVFQPANSPQELLAEAIRRGQFPRPAAASVFSMAAVSTAARAAAAHSPPAPNSTAVRPAAVAGTFYPAEPQQVQRMLDEMLPAQIESEPWAGALVPHAGWRYSGRLAGRTLARVRIPGRVIVVGPRHHAHGAPWAVAPFAAWQIPGGRVSSDPEFARQLADAIPGLELDAGAHQQEHAIEVQLPFLARLAPDAKVLGISIGDGDLEALERLGQQLADVLRGLAERPLLVVSSDMNHFANDSDTRRLDRLALDALEACDPQCLFETVQQQRISMCGMRPAVVVMYALQSLGALRRCELVGYTTSAESSGDCQRVVGYAGALFG